MAFHAAHLLRINALELLRQPGSTREVSVTLPASEVGIDDVRVAGELRVEATATSSIDGVVVHGRVVVPWHGECRRCLVDVAGDSVSQIDELYQHHPRDADTLELAGDQIDLAPVVREYVLLDLPAAPLCRPDCAGICPACGADRNQDPCRCATGPTDLRWSALEGLHLDDDT
jgi:uncharacterized protein